MTNVIEVISAEPNKVKIKIHGHIKEEDIKDKKGNITKKTTAGDSTQEQWVGYQSFYTLLENASSVPKEEETPIEPVNAKNPHVHMHNGFLGKWMQGLSLHDILAG